MSNKMIYDMSEHDLSSELVGKSVQAIEDSTIILSYLVEQLEPIDVSTYHYRVVFKPQSIVPEIEMKVGE